MKLRLLAALAALSASVHAATPHAPAATPLDPQVPVLDLPAIDVDKALGEDLAKSKRSPGPVRYALGHAVQNVVLAPGTSSGGAWQTLPDGRIGWQLEIHAKDASSLDLGFSRFRLPHGAQLRIVDVHGGDVAGPFTDADNPVDGGAFWTPIQKTDRVRLELTLPEAKRDFLWLTLDTVHHGYKDVVDAVLKSGSCNVDVVCTAGDAWRDEIRAVAVVAYDNSGTRDGNGCSGTFVRSTASTTGPLFLSANHCDINAASARVYFNFENSTCRAPNSAASGQNGDGLLTQSLFGATMLAQSDPANTDTIAGSDFALLRFNNPLPQAANVYLGGWDRRDLAPSSATVIHHPQGDEKRISFENDPLTITSYSNNTAGSGTTHLRVADWDLGTTEGGSSGSGLWNPDHRLVGVLSGGAAACGNDQPDWFGRIAHAWEGGGSAPRRLKDWLDNGNTGATTVDGVNVNCQINVDLQSAAFANAPAAGALVRFDAATTGGSGAQTFEWFVENQGDAARTGSANNLSVAFPTAGSRQVRVRVTDATGCVGTATRALDVVNFSLTATGGAPQQVCGDNDAAIEPGERWRVPVTLRNDGPVAVPANGRVLFTEGVSAGTLPIGPNNFGYAAATSASGGASCSYGFIDIAAGADAVPALPLAGSDDGRARDAIVLGGTGFELYGQRYTRAVMSTNGFVSFDESETGEEFANDCSGELGFGGAGPQLRVLHDDLLVPATAGAGLRYRYFAACPRVAESDPAPQGCHVFQWSRMARYSDAGGDGDFEFQAIAYERSGQIVYQYRTASPGNGSSATLGITNRLGQDPLNVACNQSNAAPAGSAACIYKPGAGPNGDSGLRLEAAAPALPTIAPGAQATIDVPIAFPATATCGAGFALNWRGAAVPGASQPADTRVAQGTLGSGGACQASNACPAQVPALNGRQGLYSNPARGGNGLANFAYDGTSYAGAWYTALPDRTPTWYTLAGDYGDNLGSVPITRVRNVSGSSASVTPQLDQLGRAWIAQYDADRLVYAWRFDDGRQGIELMQSQLLPFTTPNHTQTWFAPSNSGWGLAIESLKPTPTTTLEFIGAYVYDAGGTARWLTGSSDNITGGPVALTGYRVHCPGCPWLPDWASTGQPAGTLDRSYTDPTHGSLTTNIALPAPLTGTWVRTAPLPIITIRPPVPQ